MAGDRLLGTLLRSLQTWTDQEDTPRQEPPGVAQDSDAREFDSLTVLSGFSERQLRCSRLSTTRSTSRS